MEEKKQLQKEVTSSETVKPLNRNQIHRQALLLTKLNTTYPIGRSMYQKEVSLWNKELKRKKMLNGDISLIQIILIAIVSSATSAFIIWITG